MVDSPILNHMHKVLIVDDEPSFQKLMKTQLEDKNYDVVNCLKSEEAVKLIEENSPHLVLMDIMMPKMDGLEVCRHLRADTSLPFMPIILVTAKAESKDVVAGLEAGGDEYLT
ncbi:MAG: response regulator, partial [Calditrichia bacterium]|nr:response regulator [Calditrichia bacterium]